MLNLQSIVHAVLEEYPLPMSNIHGVAHWARVLENGVKLAEATGANLEVVQLFAVLHDARRVTEKSDPTHGIRGAEFAARLQGKLFQLNDDAFDLLFVACAGHMDNPVDDDVTVQVCWDADRLDVGRVGGKIDPLWLGEATVDNFSHIMAWADQRARAHVIPELIRRDWGIRTDRWHKKPGAKSSTQPSATPDGSVLV